MGGNQTKIAYVVSSLNPGGAERLVVDMSKAFSKDYDISIFCLDEPGTWANEARTSGIPVYCLWRQPGIDLSVPVRLAQILRGLKVNLIHAHQCTPWFYCAISRLFYSAPRLLFQEHGRFYPEIDSRKRRWFNRWVIRKLTHYFVAVSKDIRERLAMYEGLDLKEIKVVYNGVILDSPIGTNARRKMRRQLGYRDEDFVVGSVGRLDPIKNFTMLVDCIQSAGRRISNLYGIIIGDGPERSTIASYIKFHDCGDRMQLAGYKRDASILVQCFDLFVLTSISEGTSVALLEAMGAGVPVAVTDVGGNPEIVIAGKCGWVVPLNSIRSLTDAIVDVATNQGKAECFAAAGRKRCEELFAFDAMIHRYHKIYSEMYSVSINLGRSS